MNGCGEHYGGPGMSVYRTYSRCATETEELLLAHGNPIQKQYSLFSRTELIHPVVGSRFPILNQWEFIRRGKQWLQDNVHSFDVFFAVMAYQNAVSPALYVSEKLNKPAFVRVATSRSDLGPKNGFKSAFGLVKARRQMVKKLDGIFAISAEIEDELREIGVPEHKILGVGNGVDTERFSPASLEEKQRLRHELGIPDRFTFIFSGALVRKKNPLLVVEGLKKCLDAGYDTQAIFAGPAMEPEYYSEILDTVDRYEIGSRVIFPGFVENPEDYYRSSDLFILPSSREGMSNAMLEAAATGLPVLIGNVSGAKDLIEWGAPAGRVLDIADPIEVYQAMLAYVANRELAAQHGFNALNTIRERFSSSYVYKRHMEIFKEAINRRQRGTSSRVDTVAI